MIGVWDICDDVVVVCGRMFAFQIHFIFIYLSSTYVLLPTNNLAPRVGEGKMVILPIFTS